MTIYDQTLGLSMLLLLGYFGGRLAKLVKMPMVAGYVLTGLLIGPSFLSIIPNELNTEFNLIKILGLGLIALMIGGELEIRKIRHLGKTIVGTAVIQVAGSFVVVFSTMYFLLNLSLPVSILLGAMSTATAPASPVAVIREYKAKGPFTTTLLGVVAVDDAICIVIFGVSAAIARMLLDGTFTLGIHMFAEPAIELIGSVGLGAIAGITLTLIVKKLNDKQHQIVVFVGLALLVSGIANTFHLSPLLANMTVGFFFSNLSSKPQTISVINEIDLPIFIVFFTLAGASLHMDVLAANWQVALVYIIARGIGKVGGAFVGARVSGAPTVVQKYLGFAMFSKAGVTIGLVMLVQGRFPEIAAIITAIELAAVTFCELTGPLGTRFAIFSSGEHNNALYEESTSEIKMPVNKTAAQQPQS
ncbi:cation:proton antiporter [Tindallia californiensis]|uniref:Kef-type K+ transport system, membrane component KefB n=1 Tax=Tindallia californiensis TaxID=159292 RepID=A0A1H3J242_9FIRM|nr:cation:proton antiporter [Tindallia californiensis]SDY33488.1 Kef-type K+ transport system, membrane component KefB [Tindallia californiensis]